LTSRLERTVVSEKMIEDDLNRVEESETKSTYKGEKSALMFVPSSNYHKEKETLKSTKTHYPSNPKPSFNPKREVSKETPKPREEAFICMFYRRAGHLYEFCFCRKRIEKMCFNYARNSYVMSLLIFFIDFSSRASSRASSHFFHGSNNCSYSFGSRENSFVPICFCYGPCSHHGDRSQCRHGFLARGSYTHFEPGHLDGPRFPRHGSCPTRSNGEVQKTVKTSSGRMVKCWIPKFYLTNPSTKPSTSSHPV
jgi:hypothetical protein